MDRFMKFQSICATSVHETKFALKNMTDKNFEKIDIKIVISTQQYTSVPYFSQFVERQILD